MHDLLKFAVYPKRNVSLGMESTCVYVYIEEMYIEICLPLPQVLWDGDPPPPQKKTNPKTKQTKNTSPLHLFRLFRVFYDLFYNRVFQKKIIPVIEMVKLACQKRTLIVRKTPPTVRS